MTNVTIISINDAIYKFIIAEVYFEQILKTISLKFRNFEAFTYHMTLDMLLSFSFERIPRNTIEISDTRNAEFRNSGLGV